MGREKDGGERRDAKWAIGEAARSSERREKSGETDSIEREGRGGNSSKEGGEETVWCRICRIPARTVCDDKASSIGGAEQAGQRQEGREDADVRTPAHDACHLPSQTLHETEERPRRPSLR